MTDKEKYIYGDANGNIHILTEDDFPKCPITGDPVGVWIIGGMKKKTPKIEHFNCRCEQEITCNSPDFDYDIPKKGDVV